LAKKSPSDELRAARWRAIAAALELQTKLTALAIATTLFS
jgi:hypothetical protein